MRDDWVVACHPAAVQAFTFERDQLELRAELDGFLSACREGMVLFDIGAHFGLFPLAALHATGGRARAIAVDPSAAALTVFDANMRLANAGSRVARFQAAIADRDGVMPLLSGGAGSWQMMVTPDAPRADAVDVAVMTLATLVERTGLVPTHVKIDVEGEEDAVLRGGDAILRRNRPIVFLELHGGILRRRGRAPRAVLERLYDAGYRSFTIAGREVSFDEAAAMDVARVICRTEPIRPNALIM